MLTQTHAQSTQVGRSAARWTSPEALKQDDMYVRTITTDIFSFGRVIYAVGILHSLIGLIDAQ
jgi:hypothetical protein